MTEKAFNRLVRLGVGLVSLFMWAVSVEFSAEGFGFNVPQYKLVGYGLAIGITMFELMLNENQNLSGMLIIIGFLAYAYGVSTNILGFWLAQNRPNYYNEPWLAAIAVIFSLVIECAPPSTFMWSLGVVPKDIVRSILGLPQLRSKKQQTQYTMPLPPYQSYPSPSEKHTQKYKQNP
jgi:glucan phosphoethanolaminetransferase (alkaline phosphatase superfamily)